MNPKPNPMESNTTTDETVTNFRVRKRVTYVLIVMMVNHLCAKERSQATTAAQQQYAQMATAADLNK